MQDYILEVCVDSVESALEAKRAVQHDWNYVQTL